MIKFEQKMADRASEIQTTLQITQIPTALPNAQYIPSAADTPMPTLPSKIKTEITEQIKTLVDNPNFEVTIWNQNGELASEGEIPYEVIINGSLNKTIVTDCDFAKMLTYDMLEIFYKDNEIRPTLSRVMITIPYYLRVSLGANDGVPMAEHDSFSGQTNFWTVMEKMGLGENETAEMKNRTWGTYLTKCQ